MPTVFLSYSRADEDRAKRLVQELESRGVNVSWDQRNLRAGESWPKALGDAIAASDGLTVLWSRQAAESDWVESEWSTALAHRKPVFPCLLDSTPLPSSLRRIQAIEGDDLADAAEGIAGALGLVTNPVERPPGHKRRKIWAAAVFVILVILAVFALRSPKRGEQTLAGTIGDENGRPLPDVQVSVLLDGNIITSGSTDDIGHYNLKVAAPEDTEVTLVAKKDHYLTDQRYARLGNTEFGFNMRSERK